jgi:hypothetical protein
MNGVELVFLENALNPKPAVVPIPLLDILLMAISFLKHT